MPNMPKKQRYFYVLISCVIIAAVTATLLWRAHTAKALRDLREEALGLYEEIYSEIQRTTDSLRENASLAVNEGVAAIDKKKSPDSVALSIHKALLNDPRVLEACLLIEPGALSSETPRGFVMDLHSGKEPHALHDVLVADFMNSDDYLDLKNGREFIFVPSFRQHKSDLANILESIPTLVIEMPIFASGRFAGVLSLETDIPEILSRLSAPKIRDRPYDVYLVRTDGLIICGSNEASHNDDVENICLEGYSEALKTCARSYTSGVAPEPFVQKTHDGNLFVVSRVTPIGDREAPVFLALLHRVRE